MLNELTLMWQFLNRKCVSNMTRCEQNVACLRLEGKTEYIALINFFRFYPRHKHIMWEGFQEISHDPNYWSVQDPKMIE